MNAGRFGVVIAGAGLVAIMASLLGEASFSPAVSFGMSIGWAMAIAGVVIMTNGLSSKDD